MDEQAVLRAPALQAVAVQPVCSLVRDLPLALLVLRLVLCGRGQQVIVRVRNGRKASGIPLGRCRAGVRGIRLRRHCAAV
eukprot:9835746-Lingulodinium_polyedra.AAC.1